jgi:hypothetical protein
MRFGKANDYCAYSHYAAMLERTGVDWLIAVYETYFDDSGTNAQSEIAIAACYVSTELGWRKFVKDWELARYEEGFDVFHMAEFIAPRVNSYMPKIYPVGEENFDRLHPGFRLLRQDQEMDLGFFTGKNLNVWIKRIEDHEAEHGIIY